MKLLQALNRYGAHIGGLIFLLSALLIGVDVLLRRFFSVTLGGADELASYSLALGSALGFGSALIDRVHVRIDSLYMLFSAGIQRCFDIVGMLLFIAFFGMVTYTGAEVAISSLQMGSISNSALQIPLFIPQFLWVIGLGACVLTGFIVLCIALRRLRTSTLADVGTLIGAKSASEEVSQEIRDHQHMVGMQEVSSS